MPGVTNRDLVNVVKDLHEKVSQLLRAANILRATSYELLRQTRSMK